MTSLTRRLPGFAVPRTDGRLVAPMLLLAVALLIRWPFLGHPMIHVDEQFYLLAGQRLVEGWLPYVDIWDRKPVGLFLIFGAIRMLGGDGIVQYQLIATLFAAITAHAVYLIARRSVSSPASFAAALIYLALLAPINGAGGQSPVFYNALVAWSALLVLRASDSKDETAFRRYGCAAMLCAGLALQVKYVAVIEGAFFGAWLLWAARGREHRGLLSATLVRGALFAGVALLPTLVAAAWFAAAGAFEPFLHANFVSIFQREAAPLWFERDAFMHSFRMLAFPFACTLAALILSWVRGVDQDRLFLLLWLAFAIGGFLAIGNYFDHYALPLLLPMSVILARLFSIKLAGPLLFAALFLQATVFGLYRYSATADGRAITAAMTADIAPATAAGQCLFVADTPMVLYLTTRACGPWRYSFPFHLIDGTEARSGGDDHPDAMRAILAARPGAIVTGAPDFPPTIQKGNVALLKRRLASDYAVAGRYPDRGRVYSVWLRRDLLRTPQQSRIASGMRAPSQGYRPLIRH
jgi:4-amino-4-deoxy-L-arabinose transferase-like glycosyltransferase